MRKLSRAMPAHADPRSIFRGWLVLPDSLLCRCSRGWWPVVAGSVVVFIVIVMIAGTIECNRHYRRLAAERHGEGIGTSSAL